MCALATALQYEASRSLLLCYVFPGHTHAAALTMAVDCSNLLVDEIAS